MFSPPFPDVQDDSLGLLSLTNEGIAQRDRLVMQECAVRKIPVAVAIGGGYSPDHGSIVERHLSVHVAARDALQVMLCIWAKREQELG